MKSIQPLTLRMLGTSGFGVTSTRNLPAYLVNDEILLDCGEGVLKSLIQYQISLDQLKAIFITHFHADHLLGLFSILYKMAFYQVGLDFSKPRSSPPIFIPEGMKVLLDSMIKSTFSTFENVNFHLDIRELGLAGGSLDIGNYHVDWIQSIHTPVCLCYRINHILVYTGDTAPNPALTNLLSSDSVLLHEASFPDGMAETAHRVNHSTPSDSAKIAHDASISKLILTHVPDFTQEQEPEFLKNAKQIFPQIIVGKDGLLLDLQK